ncbi:SCO0607 family lipoprotein [Streptomyces griseorubiginosus]|uniref:SCO0607 family lipoprotein n=1 Tax=Streptomyces griseorubiginosus TaxID=67304 RepID=UPI003644BD75
MTTPRSESLTNSGLRPRTARIGTALAGAAALLSLTGCAGWEYKENICSSGEYPALSVGSTGSACVPDGERPDAGYTRYPEGKVPQEVGDKWDVYWETHTLDEKGKIIEVSPPR